MNDLISRHAALEAIINTEYSHDVTLVGGAYSRGYRDGFLTKETDALDAIECLPSAQTERDTPKRIIWKGWNGYSNTRYYCPNCNKPVRRDDVYCHRCGQHLMFPHISFTPYVKGQTQEVIVRWDDE